MIAQVEIHEIYGKKTIYPLNEQAQLLARIAGTKTLTPQTVDLAKKLGFHFEIIHSYSEV
jgi:hypothetical protein